jgi:hypothetical protein
MDENDNVARLVPAKTDAEKAAEYKRKLADAMTPVCALMTEAKREGLTLAFGMAHDAMGRYFVASLQITKEL